MGESQTTNNEVIFETWLYKLRGEFGEKKLSHYLSSAWSKRYFVLLREGNVPKLYYYNKKPRNDSNGQKGMIELDQHYRVDHKPPARGKEFIFQLTTVTKTVILAAEDEHIYDLLLFFLRTQIRLKDEYEGECFVVRPERSEDHRRIGAQSAMCLLHVSQWGLTLALQLSKSVLTQWPLYCIRWYECTGRGRFTIETGSHASTGSGRYVFKTRVGQDSAIYDRIDTFVNEQAKLQGMVMARASQLSGGLEAYMLNYSGLNSLTEVVADIRFITYLKKIAREIYDHLSEHLGGGGGGAALMDSYSSTGSSADLLSERNYAAQVSSIMRSHAVNVGQSHGVNMTQQSGSAPSNNIVIPSQYLHTGATPVFEMSPMNNQNPSFEAPNNESIPSDKVDYSLEQFIDAPDSSGCAEVFRSRRTGASSYKSTSRCTSWTRLRIRSLSLDDLSDYVGATEQSYTNSVFQEEKGDAAARQSHGDDVYPYSYATAPDFGFMSNPDERSNALDEDGYCRPKSGLTLRTLSDPNLLEENGVYHRATSAEKPKRDSRIKSVHRVVIKQRSQQGDSPLRHSKGGERGPSESNPCTVSGQTFAGAAAAAVATAVDHTAGGASQPVNHAVLTESKSVKGVNVTPKTRVFTKQKSLGTQSPSTSSVVSPLSLTPFSLPVSSPLNGPPMMVRHPVPEQPPLDRSQRRLPDIPPTSTRHPHHSTARTKETTSFV